jgi:hypothetical protein
MGHGVEPLVRDRPHDRALLELARPLGVDRVAERPDLGEEGLEVRGAERRAPAGEHEPCDALGRIDRRRVATTVPIECPGDDAPLDAGVAHEGDHVAGQLLDVVASAGRGASPCPRRVTAYAWIEAGRCVKTGSNERNESLRPCTITTGVPSGSPSSAYGSRTADPVRELVICLPRVRRPRAAAAGLGGYGTPRGGPSAP